MTMLKGDFWMPESNFAIIPHKPMAFPEIIAMKCIPEKLPLKSIIRKRAKRCTAPLMPLRLHWKAWWISWWQNFQTHRTGHWHARESVIYTNTICDWSPALQLTGWFVGYQSTLLIISFFSHNLFRKSHELDCNAESNGNDLWTNKVKHHTSS